MEERLARIISNTASFDALATFEENARVRNALTDEVREAIKHRSAQLGRTLIHERTGIDLSDLSPAGEKIVEAVSEYVGVMKRQGKDATRTFEQLKNRGLIEAAETAVAKSEPTQGFQTLADVGREDLSYEQIIVDHSEEFSPRAIWYSRRTLGLSNESPKPPAPSSSLTQLRTETFLKWLEERAATNDGRLAVFTNTDTAAVLGMADMHRYGRVLGNLQSRIDFACYRVGLPPLGLAAERPFDLAWSQEGRDWAFPIDHMQAAAQAHVWTPEDFRAILKETERLSGQAHIPWKRELSIHEADVKAWAFGLEVSEGGTARLDGGADEREEADVPAREPAYWVFVCNPKRWAIDRFLEQRIEQDSWGVRKSDSQRFAPGQLGLVRVGTDQRSVAEREGKPKLEAGIYALCEVDSEAYPASGAADEFWADGAAREPGWPTVKIRYLRTYLDNPLTIERLRSEAPQLSPLLLDGFQASSFPIPAPDFQTVLQLLKEDVDDLPGPRSEEEVTAAQLEQLERKYLHASPEVRERLSKSVERGTVGAFVKKANGYRCQVCEALGRDPIAFRKPDGLPYVEAHHVTPVFKGEIGTLAASNVMTVCANHHRQLHYGGIVVMITSTTFDLTIDGIALSVRRLAVGVPFEDLPRLIEGASVIAAAG